MEPITTGGMMATGAWIGKKLFGPTLEAIGEDLKKLYEKGRDKIIANAIKKTKNIDSKGQTNLRVTRDVFWNGSFTDESICAEYFGGILAASRSEDGKDDSGVFYVDIIKSLSSNHLKMHYIIYRTLNKTFIANEKKAELYQGQGIEEDRLILPMFYIRIKQSKNEDIGAILHGLAAKNLISRFMVSNSKRGKGKTIYNLMVMPEALGIQLFAIAYNKFGDWKNFSSVDFGDFDDMILPQHYGLSSV